MSRVPHLAYPLRLTEQGTLATVDQDTYDDVAQCVRVLIRTPKRSRPLAPKVGITDPTFTQGLNVDLLAAELAEHEPRANVQITVGPGPDPNAHVLIPGPDLLPGGELAPGTPVVSVITPAEGRQAVRVSIALADETADDEDIAP